MSGIEHNIPNMIGVDQSKLENRMKQLIPEYIPMGETGMGEIFEMSHHMPLPKNFLPFGSPGPFGMIEMSGMFTIVKVREGITNYTDPGWFQNPHGTVASPVKSSSKSPAKKPSQRQMKH